MGRPGIRDSMEFPGETQAMGGKIERERKDEQRVDGKGKDGFKRIWGEVGKMKVIRVKERVRVSRGEIDGY